MSPYYTVPDRSCDFEDYEPPCWNDTEDDGLEHAELDDARVEATEGWQDFLRAARAQREFEKERT